MKTSELLPMGFTQSLIDIWHHSGFKDLLPVQIKALQEFNVLDSSSGNLLIVAPTSSGKTFVGELAAVKESLEMRKTVFLVPFRAIAEEIFADFTMKYGDYGLRIAISDRDHREYDEEILRGDYDIAIIVYEKLSGLLSADANLLSGVGLIVADEVQMIMDQDRGPAIELLLTRILSDSQRIRTISLSAVLDNLNDFDKWLKAKVLLVRSRPIELREAIYSADGVIVYREFNSRNGGSEKLTVWDSMEEGLLNLVQSFIDAGQQALVFCSTRRSTVSIAQSISRRIKGSSASSETIRLSNELPDALEKELLQNLLHFGVAYHNSDLTLEERLLVEHGFRQRDIRILTCTSTLSMGVNLPSRNVVVFQPTKWNGQRFVPISVAEYKNMAGRAGRYSAGDQFGTSYLLSQSESTTDSLLLNYISGSLEGFSSTFGDQVIDLQVLQIIAGGLARTSKEVNKIIFATYNGQFKWKSDQSRKSIGQMVAGTITECLDSGAIEQLKNDRLQVTQAGKLCASGGFSLHHLENARSYLAECKEALDLSVIFWALSIDYECGSSAYYIGRMRTQEFRSLTYQRMLVELSQTERVGPLLERLADHPQAVTYDSAVVLRRTLACYSWISTLPTRKITESFPGVTIGSIRNTSEVCARLIAFLSELSKLMRTDKDIQSALETLVERLSRGSTKDALQLARLRRTGLSRDERNFLVAEGISNIDDVIDRRPEDIPLPRSKALRLIKAAESSITDHMERRRRSQRARLNAISIDTMILEALYIRQGKELEKTIDELLSPPFLNIACRRVTRQNEGEPDHVLYRSDGKPLVIQTTAREKKRISITKATSVIGQSAKYKPVGYLVFGRPDFDELAVKDSEHQIQAGLNYKLVPIYTLAEMFVLFHEKRLSTSMVERILLEETGYIGLSELYDATRRDVGRESGVS